VINWSDTLTVANGGKLTSGTGNVQISGALTLNGDIEQGGGTLNLPQAVTVGATGNLDASDSDGVNFGSTLNIAGGGKLSSGTGNTSLLGALTLNGEIEQGGGIINLTQGGTVGATGKLDVSDSELKLGGALNISGTLAANSSSQWSGWSGTLDLTAGTLEAAGGSLSLSQISTGTGTTLKLSADTEITSASNYTFGTVNLSGKKLTMGGNGGLTLPNALNMSAGSKIETKTSDLTLSSALQLTTGSITSTGGTFIFAGGATLSNSGQLDVSGTNLKVHRHYLP
jgi:hypothetical protein